MDLLYGVKGFLPVLFFIVAAVAITSDDPLTKILLGALAVGIIVGIVWDPVSRLIAKIRHNRGEL